MKWKGTCNLSHNRDPGAGLAPTLWYGIALLTLAAIYLGTGRLGLSLGAVSGFATLIWLPSGLAVTALFLWGSRLWPAITLGAFLVNLFTGAPLPCGRRHRHRQYPGSSGLYYAAQTQGGVSGTGLVA